MMISSKRNGDIDIKGDEHMILRVTPEAVQRFQKEWGFASGDTVRIFVRYSGFSESGPYSFGIMKDTPRYPAVLVEIEGISFFMEQNDTWFVEEEALTIAEANEEIVFRRHASSSELDAEA